MSAETNDRAAGAVLGMAAGDALGAGYEFGPALPDDAVVEMKGGGGFGWAPGEWTDDTSMAVPILRAAAAGKALTDPATRDELVAAWSDWARTAPDVGTQTRAVLGGLRATTAEAARAAAKTVHDRTGRSGGNGSLMRTAPVALAHLDDVDALMAAASGISSLTHFDPEAGEACVIWCLAIRHAIRRAELDIRGAIALLPQHRQQVWLDRVDEAEAKRPRDFARNGWVVEAFQAAWSAIATTPVPEDLPARHLQLALEAAVRGGRDTDTVAAIAGGLLGARWGASAVPAAWRRILHGWPGLDADDLVRLAVLAKNGGRPDGRGWPSADRFPPSAVRTLVHHPHDDGVWLGSLAALDGLPEEIDAVVSLCRVGREQTDREQVEFWLVDQAGRNPNLEFIVRDAADTIAALRAEGKTVLVHCFEGRSRTPSVGAAYSVLHLGKEPDAAIREVTEALPYGAPGSWFTDVVRTFRPALTTEPSGKAKQRPILYVDLDNTLVDFQSGIDRLPSKARAEYGPSPEHPHGHYDDAPGIFALMEPMPGAIEAFRALAKRYDTYILSTAPWDNPSAWQHKLEWVQLHFGTGEFVNGERNPAYKRLILSHHKELHRGAFLVDDRTANGAGEFEGELLQFGSAEYPDWAAVRTRLLPASQS